MSGCGAEAGPAPIQEPERGPKCDGCPENHYSATFGLKGGNEKPHSRCTHFNADIPMVVNSRKEWVRSEIPPGCPTYQQARLDLVSPARRRGG